MFIQRLRGMNKEQGFTLIELLIVIAIIAILAAIAIPQFTAYRERAVRAGMLADAKNAATIFSTVFADCGTYLNVNGTAIGPAPLTITSTAAGCQAMPVGTTWAVNTTRGNTLTVTGATASWSLLTANPGSVAFGNLTTTSAGGCTYSISGAC